ncbi:TPA: ead/Ea22-like family protein [Klebsiella michiganensis]|nr:ead/Ea22-like family protein [Klebsiella michiganensis]
MTELAQSLKAAAENATPGEWCSDDQYGIVADAGLNGNYYIASCSGPEHRQNKRFIALANPANVLALVEALELKEEQRANWFQMAQKLGEDLDAAEKRIAELESRTVTVKQYDEFQICHYGATEDYAKGYIDCQNNFFKWLTAAGIKWEAE